MQMKELRQGCCDFSVSQKDQDRFLISGLSIPLGMNRLPLNEKRFCDVHPTDGNYYHEVCKC